MEIKVANQLRGYRLGANITQTKNHDVQNKHLVVLQNAVNISWSLPRKWQWSCSTRNVHKVNRSTGDCTHDIHNILLKLKLMHMAVFYMTTTNESMHADALLYLRQFMHTTDIPSWQRLWSSTTDSLFVPAIKTFYCWTSFPVAGACIWHASDITSPVSANLYTQRLKMHLFRLLQFNCSSSL